MLNLRHKAFTLIELLTVMAIIILLIGILTPSLTAARTAAKKTAVKAQINAIEIGLEAFRGDSGEYIPSNSVWYAHNLGNPLPEMTYWEVGGVGEISGAHLLVDAMVGRDSLGYDPRAAPPTGDPDDYDRWDPNNDRRNPYIPVDGIDVTTAIDPARDQLGVIPGNTFPQPNGTEHGIPVFRCKFGFPILYYRASPVATQQTPIIQTVTNARVGDGVYDGLDNSMFTSYNGSPHRIADADGSLPHQCAIGYGTDSLDSFANGGTFAEFIRSFRATTYESNGIDILCPRPVKSDRFILLSAGRDGIYGSLDDVANYEVFSQER